MLMVVTDVPKFGIGIVCISVLFWVVFDHLIITFAPKSETNDTPLANCLEGSKVKVE